MSGRKRIDVWAEMALDPTLYEDGVEVIAPGLDSPITTHAALPRGHRTMIGRLAAHDDHAAPTDR